MVKAAVITCGQVLVHLDEHHRARLMGHRARVCLLLGEADTVLQSGHGICTPTSSGARLCSVSLPAHAVACRKHPNRCAAVSRL